MENDKNLNPLNPGTNGTKDDVPQSVLEDILLDIKTIRDHLERLERRLDKITWTK